MINFILVLLVLWFQFGADTYSRYQFNQCKEKPGLRLQGMSYKPLYWLPGGFSLLNIDVGTCEYKRRQND